MFLRRMWKGNIGKREIDGLRGRRGKAKGGQKQETAGTLFAGLKQKGTLSLLKGRACPSSLLPF